MITVETLKQKLTAQLAPQDLRIKDESSQHAGHNPAAARGGTHFNVEIVSAAFAGLSRVARQQLVYGILQNEFATGLHALSLSTKTPEESAGH